MLFVLCCRSHYYELVRSRSLVCPNWFKNSNRVKAYIKSVKTMEPDARKPVFGVCEQQRRGPDSASAQADQRLRYSLFGK